MSGTTKQKLIDQIVEIYTSENMQRTLEWVSQHDVDDQRYLNLNADRAQAYMPITLKSLSDAQLQEIILRTQKILAKHTPTPTPTMSSEYVTQELLKDNTADGWSLKKAIFDARFVATSEEKNFDFLFTQEYTHTVLTKEAGNHTDGQDDSEYETKTTPAGDIKTLANKGHKLADDLSKLQPPTRRNDILSVVAQSPELRDQLDQYKKRQDDTKEVRQALTNKIKSLVEKEQKNPAHREQIKPKIDFLKGLKTSIETYVNTGTQQTLTAPDKTVTDKVNVHWFTKVTTWVSNLLPKAFSQSETSKLLDQVNAKSAFVFAGTSPQAGAGSTKSQDYRGASEHKGGEQRPTPV